jgi:DNA mismatch endonuclease (patch repair protein)
MGRDTKKEVRQKIVRPVASSMAALKRMQAAKPRDTAPEKAIRSALHRLGLRYSLDVKPVEDLNRRADILFRSLKIAVFVDGCFWHGCPIHGTQAKANAEFWRTKINRNQERDTQTTKYLEQAGWKVIRVWEHEDPILASKKIYRIVNQRRKLMFRKT